MNKGQAVYTGLLFAALIGASLWHHIRKHHP